MNSKMLQEKIKEIESHEIEMRLLKRTESGQSQVEAEIKGVCSSKSTVSLKHYDQLLCDLRCPGCTNRLTAPIYLCLNGHSLCRICHFTLNTCPICSKDLTDMRSCTLERLANKFQFPCKNLRNGCNVRLPMELMKWHEEKCIFKKTSCFMGKVWNDCSWIGREDEWLNHCKEKHSQKILQNQDVFELVWNYDSLLNHSGPVEAYYLIQNYGETFNLYQIHEAKCESLTWTVMLADYKETSLDKKLNADLPKFSFEIELYRKDDPRFVIIQRFPVHYADSDTLLDEGKCVKIPLKDVQRFLDEEKNLNYNLRIVTCKVKKDRWNELLGMAKVNIRGDAKDTNFAFFDSLEDDEIYDRSSDEFQSVSIDVLRERRDSDMLKQIYSREFREPTSEDPLLSQAPHHKPPRKSLENRPFDDDRRDSASSHRYANF